MGAGDDGTDLSDEELYTIHRRMQQALTPKGDPDNPRHRKAALDIFLTFEIAGADWFTAELIRLINKSVGGKRRQLAEGFPDEVLLYGEWEAAETPEAFYERYGLGEMLNDASGARQYYYRHYGRGRELWWAEQRLMAVVDRICTECFGAKVVRIPRLTPKEWPPCTACGDSGRFDNQAAKRGEKFFVEEVGFNVTEVADKVEPDVVMRTGALLIDREHDEQRKAKEEAAQAGEEGGAED